MCPYKLFVSEHRFPRQISLPKLELHTAQSGPRYNNNKQQLSLYPTTCPRGLEKIHICKHACFCLYLGKRQITTKFILKPPKVQHFPSNIVITFPSVFHLSLSCGKFISLFSRNMVGRKNVISMSWPGPALECLGIPNFDVQSLVSKLQI